MNALLLFAHGSRDPAWYGAMHALRDRAQAAMPNTLVGCAYLEWGEPNLPDAVAQAVSQGAQRIHVLPVFFGQGRHVREDLPALVAQLRSQHPSLALDILTPVGDDPGVQAAIVTQALHSW